MYAKILEKLEKRKLEGTLRSLSFLDSMEDFYSNDYLGLAKINFNHSSNGSTGSRLLSGNTTRMTKFEEQIAAYFAAPQALYFGSGYQANLGFFSSVPQRDELVIYDQEIHASIRDGLRLGLAKALSFRHNDLDHLDFILKKEKPGAFIAVEGLYSMSGTFSNVHEILRIAEKYQSKVIIDEAHSAGVSGLENRGLSFEIEHPQLFARIVTFGKAYGAHGAVILGNEVLKNYLINFCRPFIYTTAPPESSMEWVIRNVQLAGETMNKQRCQENLDFFRSLVPNNILVSDAQSPIQMLRFSEERSLNQIVESCWDQQLACKAIYTPTVAPGEEGLRINLHAFNDMEKIKLLARIVS